jgi:hypothetical protein
LDNAAVKASWLGAASAGDASNNVNAVSNAAAILERRSIDGSELSPKCRAGQARLPR